MNERRLPPVRFVGNALVAVTFKQAWSPRLWVVSLISPGQIAHATML